MDALQSMMARIQKERATQQTRTSSHLLNGSQMTENRSSDCPVCRGTGWIYWRDAEGIEYGKRCSCGLVERQIMERKLKFANIPEAFKSLELSSFRSDVYQRPESRKMIQYAAEVVKYYLANIESMKAAGMGLYFYSGTRGSGKTRMVASIANELIKKHRIQVKFAGSVQIVNEIRSTWDSREQNESELLSALASVDVLAIDDFGAELPKDWIGERFYSIINGRYQDKLPTLFTSNMSLEDLRYDDRITNRIKERTFQIHFPEESVRERIAEQNQQWLLGQLMKK